MAENPGQVKEPARCLRENKGKLEDKVCHM